VTLESDLAAPSDELMRFVIPIEMQGVDFVVTQIQPFAFL